MKQNKSADLNQNGDGNRKCSKYGSDKGDTGLEKGWRALIVVWQRDWLYVERKRRMWPSGSSCSLWGPEGPAVSLACVLACCQASCSVALCSFSTSGPCLVSQTLEPLPWQVCWEWLFLNFFIGWKDLSCSISLWFHTIYSAPSPLFIAFIVLIIPNRVLLTSNC